MATQLIMYDSDRAASRQAAMLAGIKYPSATWKDLTGLSVSSIDSYVSGLAATYDQIVVCVDNQRVEEALATAVVTVTEGIANEIGFLTVDDGTDVITIGSVTADGSGSYHDAIALTASINDGGHGYTAVRADAVITISAPVGSGVGGDAYTLAQDVTNGGTLALTITTAFSASSTGITAVGTKGDITQANMVSLVEKTDLLAAAVRDNTAQAGVAGSITLDTGASAVDDYYNNMQIMINGGTGDNQTRLITDYDGTTKIALVDMPWDTNPANDSEFVISEDLMCFGRSGVGDESLDETDFATHANWDVTGKCVDSGGNAEWTFGTGALGGTLTQVAADQAIKGAGSSWYEFEYTVAVTTAPDGDTAFTITTGYALAAVTLKMTAGTHKVRFMSKAIPADFVLDVTETTATQGQFSVDNVSLKQVRHTPPMKAWEILMSNYHTAYPLSFIGGLLDIHLYEKNGNTATSVAAGTLTDNNEFVAAAYDEKDYYVAIKTSTVKGEAGQIRKIASNTASVLTLSKNWDVTPTGTVTYQIGRTKDVMLKDLYLTYALESKFMFSGDTYPSTQIQDFKRLVDRHDGVLDSRSKLFTEPAYFDELADYGKTILEGVATGAVS